MMSVIGHFFHKIITEKNIEKERKKEVAESMGCHRCRRG
jgi:hypothetical protein